MNWRIERRIYWRLLRVLGFKQLAWDQQFKAGLWCRAPRSAHTIKRVTELCNGGPLLEFGCGEGTLAVALPDGCFSRYVGYDISEVAVQRAAERARAAGLTNCQFKQGDMAEWTGTSGASLVVVEECLYYLSLGDAATFLRRACDSLAPDGNVLVIIYSPDKYRRLLDTCRSVCSVKDESLLDGRTFLTLVGQDRSTCALEADLGTHE